MIDIEKIRAGAEAATPGPWVANTYGLGVYPESKNFSIAATTGNSGPYENYKANCSHIANCDPDTVLEMIAVIDAALKLSPHLEVLAPSSSAHLRRLLKALETS